MTMKEVIPASRAGMAGFCMAKLLLLQHFYHYIVLSSLFKEWVNIFNRMFKAAHLCKS